MPQEPTRVLMVHANPCIRVLKEIKALRMRGLSVDMLCTQLANQPAIKNYVGHIYTWSTLLELRIFLEHEQQRWDVIHCHNEPNDFIAVAIDACRERPVIYDVHDFTSARTPSLDPLEAAIESYCFKHIAAVVHVSDGMKRLAFKKYGPCLSIVLPSLPSREAVRFTRRSKLPGNHVAYQGGIVGSKDVKYSYRYYLPFFKRLCEAGIDVHVFPPSSKHWDYLTEYTTFAAKNPHLHLHPSLPYENLLEELSQFQWGLTGFNFDHVPEEGKAFLDNALPNKFFDYLLAGVCPIVINNATTAAFAREHHVGFSAGNMEEFISICRTQQPLSPPADPALIDMNIHIEKLVKLYEAVRAIRKRKQAAENFADSLKSLTPNKSIPGIAFFNIKNTHTAILDVLLQYYTSGVWLYKEPDIYFSHTSADSHAFYLMAFCCLFRKQKDMATLKQLTDVANLLLRLDNAVQGGNPGWGLGAAYQNKVNPSHAVSPPQTTFTYTSSVVGRALLEAYEVTGTQAYLDACSAWRQSFFEHIGLDPDNGCCYYADHESYKSPLAFVPNATPLFMGFLAEYARVTGSKEDKPLLAKLCKNFMALEKCGNWQYNKGRTEDLLHLAMIAEGLYFTNTIIGNMADTTNLIRGMLKMMFSGLSIKESPSCWGGAYWGPAWALSVFLKYDVPKEYIYAGVYFLKNNFRLMLYNIRTASLYAKLFSEL